MFAVEQDRIKNEHLQNKLSVHNIADIVQHLKSNCIDLGYHASENLVECKPPLLELKPTASKPSLEKANALTMDISRLGSTLRSQKRIGIDSEMTSCLRPEKSVPDLALVC